MKIKIIVLSCVVVFFILSLVWINVKTGVFSNNPYNGLIAKYSLQYSIDPSLIKALMKKESNLNPEAVSPKGAIGLMQIMPRTAREIAEHFQMPIDDNSLKDPETNIMFGIYYLRQLMSYYEGNLILSLAAYNAGIGNVEGWIAQNPAVSKKISKIPFKETRRYVKGILFSYKIYKVKERLKL